MLPWETDMSRPEPYELEQATLVRKVPFPEISCAPHGDIFRIFCFRASCRGPQETMSVREQRWGAGFKSNWLVGVSSVEFDASADSILLTATVRRLPWQVRYTQQRISTRYSLTWHAIYPVPWCVVV